MSDWQPQANYPDLLGAEYIGIDCETCDPNLLEMGPGDIRRDGKLVGISVSVPGFKAYYPIAHEGGDNLPKDTVIRWLKRQLAGNEPKVGANIIYDLGWLESEGIKVNGPKHDAQVAEALIYELHASYRLEALAQRYLGEGKDETLLRQAALERGWKTEKQVKANLWRLPARFVGPYAERDADAAREILMLQVPKLEENELMDVYNLECRLIDALHAMRMRGMPISYEKAERTVAELTKRQQEAQSAVNHFGSGLIDVWSNQALASTCEKNGWAYPRTEKGNPSFTADWLATADSDFFKNVLLVRQLDRSSNVFIQGKILNASVKGRVHPNFKQTRRDDGGTKSGRLSSSNPNMQQVPARHPILAPLVRGIFVADDGYDFGMFDYSQQEPRVTVHYGYLRGYKGADEAREKYVTNPRTDYHQLVADLMEQASGRAWGRKVAKPINLGLAYGMGKNKLAAQLGVAVDESGPILDAYHKAVPFVRMLGDEATRQAKRRGYIRTIMGRRRHFPGGEFAHKALNAAVQGSSADMVKKAIVEVHEAGHTIYNTVHDEIDCPVRVGDRKHAAEIRDILINAMKLEVPLVVDVEVGPSWGEHELIEV